MVGGRDESRPYVDARTGGRDGDRTRFIASLHDMKIVVYPAGRIINDVATNGL